MPYDNPQIKAADIQVVARLPDGVNFGYRFPQEDTAEMWEPPIECLIRSAHIGYGHMGHFIEPVCELSGYDPEMVQTFSQVIQHENSEPAILVYPNDDPNNPFRGFITGASANCYALNRERDDEEQIPTGIRDTPPVDEVNRGYLYDVSYVAIEYAAMELQAKRIAITHWTQGLQNYRNEIICTFKALKDFSSNHVNSGLRMLYYTGCCIQPEHFQDINFKNIDKEFSDLGGTTPRCPGPHIPWEDYDPGLPGMLNGLTNHEDYLGVQYLPVWR